MNRHQQKAQQQNNRMLTLICLLAIAAFCRLVLLPHL